MELVKHETCAEYVARRLSEGWRIVGCRGSTVTLSSPGGNTTRPVNLQNDILTWRPNANGNQNDFWPEPSPEACDINYKCVDEVVPDDDASYCAAYGATDIDLYGLPAHTSEKGVINHVRVCIRAETMMAVEGRILVRTHNNNYGNDMGYVYPWMWVDYYWQLDKNPNTGEPWTWAEIDDLEVGAEVTLAGSPLEVTQAYAEVDFTPPAGSPGLTPGMMAEMMGTS